MISNNQINQIYDNAFKAGALGGKITGAGGGGCMIFFSKSNLEHIVSNRLFECGTKVIDFSFAKTGLITWQIKKNSRELKFKDIIK